MKIGYGKAAGFLDQMEEEGIVGPSNGAKGREVLISSLDIPE
jgi:S-DNA-T family DNA segregation ATPase FtsK/SpoIIIE